MNFCVHGRAPVEIVEKLLWVPADAFELLHRLREKYAGQLSEECIEEILLGANQIWLLREQSVADRVRKRHDSEVASLRKLLNQHVSFSEVTTKRQVTRLKSQLTRVTREKENIEMEKK